MSDDLNWYAANGLAVLGTGAALPGPPLSNAELFALVAPFNRELTERSFMGTARRLGIETRHISRDFSVRREAPRAGARNPDLAARAVAAALREAGLKPNDLGYLIGHTTTPAQPLPANIVQVADILGYCGPHLELRQACTGFANAVMIAHGLSAAADARPVAIVGSETGSLFFDPATVARGGDQLVNLVQMGDGAGAIIVGSARNAGARLSGAWFGATGLGRDPGLQMQSGGSDRPFTTDQVIGFQQDYAAIAAAGPALFAAGLAAAARQGLSPQQVDHIIPHQASGKIGEQISQALSVPRAKVFVNADTIGNTGSAAIWIALSALRTHGLAPKQTALILGAEATKYMHGGFCYEHG